MVWNTAQGTNFIKRSPHFKVVIRPVDQEAPHPSRNPCSQESTTGPHPGSVELSQHTHTLLLDVSKVVFSIKIFRIKCINQYFDGLIQ
jgi:hypothetical protein